MCVGHLSAAIDIYVGVECGAETLTQIVAAAPFGKVCALCFRVICVERVIIFNRDVVTPLYNLY